MRPKIENVDPFLVNPVLSHFLPIVIYHTFMEHYWVSGKVGHYNANFIDLFQGFYERKRVYSIIASAKNTAVEKEGGLRVDLCFLSLCFYRILFWNTWTHFFNFQSFLIFKICHRVLLILENNWIFRCV